MSVENKNDTEPYLILYISRRRAEELPLLVCLKEQGVLDFMHIDVAIGSLLQRFTNQFKVILTAIKYQPTIILVESMGLTALIGLICKNFSKSKLVLRLKGNVFSEYTESLNGESRLYRLYKRINFSSSKFALRKCDLILPLSKVPLKDMDLNMVNKKPVEIVYIPIRSMQENDGGFCRSLNEDFVITVTNFNFYTKAKPLILAIKKFAPLLVKCQCKWKILGDGKHLQRIKNELNDEIDQKLVEFVGQTNPVPYYQHAKAHLYFSGLETLSNSLLESYYFEVPVMINNDFPVMGESAIKDHNVIVIDLEKNTLDELKSKLDMLLFDNQERSKLIENSKELLNTRFSLVQVSESLFSAFQKIL